MSTESINKTTMIDNKEPTLAEKNQAAVIAEYVAQGGGADEIRESFEAWADTMQYLRNSWDDIETLADWLRVRNHMTEGPEPFVDDEQYE
jgi:hypothetical protein